MRTQRRAAVAAVATRFLPPPFPPILRDPLIPLRVAVVPRAADPGPGPRLGSVPRRSLGHGPRPGPDPGAVLGADAWMWILLWGHQVVPT